MRIALIHDSVIPPPGYGGIPRFMAWLAQGLLSAGHQVDLLGLPGSHVPGANFVDISGVDPWSPEILRLIPAGCDLLHFQATPRFTPEGPYLVTIHGNSLNPQERFLPVTNFVSRSHAQNHGGLLFVRHGIPPDLYAPESSNKPPPQREAFVFLAKASWSVKNLRAAISLCRERPSPLWVCGGKGFSFTRNIAYLGPIGDQKKKEILPKARALLFPVNWPEPFGLAVLEALSAGTPVIAAANGALPEILGREPGAGFLCENYEEFQAAMENLDQTRPAACRELVRREFSLNRMCADYEKLYRDILTGRLRATDLPTPVSIAGRPPHQRPRVFRIKKNNWRDRLYYNILHPAPAAFQVIDKK